MQVVFTVTVNFFNSIPLSMFCRCLGKSSAFLHITHYRSDLVGSNICKTCYDKTCVHQVNFKNKVVKHYFVEKYH